MGARNCQWYDWTSFLGNYFRAIPGITQYHHFQASREFPGEIVCREFANSDDVKFQLLKKGINVSSFSSSNLPPIVTPKGLDAQRQWYLYEQIRPFCHSNLTKDITCPKPTVSKPWQRTLPVLNPLYQNHLEEKNLLESLRQHFLEKESKGSRQQLLRQLQNESKNCQKASN